MYETPTWVAMARDAAIVLGFSVAVVAAVTAVVMLGILMVMVL